MDAYVREQEEGRSAAENLFLGNERQEHGIISWNRKMNQCMTAHIGSFFVFGFMGQAPAVYSI